MNSFDLYQQNMNIFSFLFKYHNFYIYTGFEKFFLKSNACSFLFLKWKINAFTTIPYLHGKCIHIHNRRKLECIPSIWKKKKIYIECISLKNEWNSMNTYLRIFGNLACVTSSANLLYIFSECICSSILCKTWEL